MNCGLDHSGCKGAIACPPQSCDWRVYPTFLTFFTFFWLDHSGSVCVDSDVVYICVGRDMVYVCVDHVVLVMWCMHVYWSNCSGSSVRGELVVTSV